MKRIHSIILASVAAVSLATVPVACGTYGSTGGSGGSSSASGGAAGNPSGGAAGNPSGGTTGNASGGATPSGGTTVTPSGGTTVTPGGGSGGNASGGTTVKPSGGSGGNGTGGATSSGGATGSGGATSSGGVTGAGGSTSGSGGTSARTGGSSGSGGTSAGSGGTSTGSGGSTGTGGSSPGALPGDILNNAGNKVVSAHSTVRVIVTGYTGPLYQLCKGTANPGPSSCKGTTQDVGSKAGYADVAAHNAFCPTGTACTMTKIYDQSGQKNDLEPGPSGSGGRTTDNPVNASDLKVTINGNSVYGILIKAGMGYRTGCKACNIKTGIGMATGDQPQTMYMVTSQKDLIDGCCFDYGNAETDANDDGNGTMETIYFGGGVVWGTGSPGGHNNGPWVEADLENGLYAGWENGQDQNISTNKPLKFDFVTAIVLGDTKDKNSGKGRFALYGADATGADATYGKLATMYDGIRPAKNGYVPMAKQGAIILGTGGDNSNGDGGRFYEGAIATGTCATQATLDALQTAIVAANYGK